MEGGQGVHKTGKCLQADRDCHLLGIGPSCSRLAKGTMGNVLSVTCLSRHPKW